MTLDDLAAYGADVQEGLARCMGMEDLYLKLAQTIATEEKFTALQDALAHDDYSGAFSAAHALKGVLANLAITPLLKPVEELVELLRKQEPVDCAQHLDAVLSEWERFRAL